MPPVLENVVLCVLHSVGLEKYVPIFEKHSVNMELFLTLTADDLCNIGVEQNEDADRLLKAISTMKPKSLLREGLSQDESGDYSMSEAVELMLKNMRLEKYIPLFKKLEVTMEVFVNIKRTDLESIGITDQQEVQRILKVTQKIKNLSGFATKKDENESFVEGEEMHILKNACDQMIAINAAMSYMSKAVSGGKMTGCPFMETATDDLYNKFHEIMDLVQAFDIQPKTGEIQLRKEEQK